MPGGVINTGCVTVSMNAILCRPEAEDSMVAESDLELIRRILNGEGELYRLLIEANSQQVSVIVSKRVDWGEVDVVAHDVFVRAFNSLATYRGEQPFSHWLSKIAVRECIDVWRRRARVRESSFSELSTEQQQLLDSLGTRELTSDEERHVAADYLRKALSQLSPEDRAVVILVHVEELSIAEAAELLGWSRVNVKVRAHRARQKLRKIIEADSSQG